MNLYDLVRVEDLHSGLRDGLISERGDGDGLLIYNYTDRAIFTEGAWDNPAVRQCRGLIVEERTGDIIARPWSKFWNYGEHEEGSLNPSSFVEVTDKQDGSLGIVFRNLNGFLQVATRGSFQSEQATHATEVLQGTGGYIGWWADNFTPLVEIIYPGNRIVLDYGDRDDLILLGAVHIETGDYFGPREAAGLFQWTGPVTETFEYSTLMLALRMKPRQNAEGVCVRFLGDQKIVKIKQDDYVRLHRIVTGLSERTVWEYMMQGDNPYTVHQQVESLILTLPEELHEWTWDVAGWLHHQAYRTYLEARNMHNYIMFWLPQGSSRKDYAMQAKQYPDLQHYLFKLLDGKDIWKPVLSNLKPRGDTHAKPVSEETA